MALGFSGSNGGISSNYRRFDAANTDLRSLKGLPLEVSYFVNNVCNLNCRHCYVGYKDTRYANSYEVWTRVFSELIGMGARTFGNVGKEPLLEWELTRKLLAFFQEKQKTNPEIRYGFVTNGLLLSDAIISDLLRLAPTYIDISLDGNREAHEIIRGEGTYEKLISNLRKLAETILADRIFISITLNKLNKNTIGEIVETISGIGIKKLLLSPYVTLDKKDSLYLSDEEMADTVSGIVRGETVDFHKVENLTLYVKSDYSTSKGLTEILEHKGLISPATLFVDEYGVLFNKHEKGSNIIYFNYLPYDNTFSQAIRISHDGYVSGCLDMFYEDYTTRAIGNINEMPIGQVLRQFFCHRPL